MKQESRKTIIPPGPIFSLALIGLMLLCGLLYYKAVRFQRFLEPALALTQPGSEFDENVRNHIRGEFGPEYANDIWFSMDAIQVSKAALNGKAEMGKGPVVYSKFASVFKNILDDPNMRSNIKVILVSTITKVSDDPKLVKVNDKARRETQDMAEDILRELFLMNPELETKYGAYFEATAMPVHTDSVDTSRVYFRIIPSERLHIEVLQRLQKYAE